MMLSGLIAEAVRTQKMTVTVCGPPVPVRRVFYYCCTASANIVRKH
jgi:hypothetical protein